jgi:hypothetical protein
MARSRPRPVTATGRSDGRSVGAGRGGVGGRSVAFAGLVGGEVGGVDLQDEQVAVEPRGVGRAGGDGGGDRVEDGVHAAQRP